jgi:predicted Zn-dependent protease
MRRNVIAIVFAITALPGLLLLAGCSSSGKKGDKPKRTVLATTYDDAKVGEESSMAVAAQMGVLDDAALNAYVSEIGRKLLRGIPRRSFNYQFSVVDQIEPNAFALPGGYVFISRGLLALANNEDELACVIGHEITHAAHRHAALQQQISQRVSPLAMGWRRAATLSSYGRDMERDADQGGQQLCAAAGYDPIGMSTFLNNLGQWERYRIGYTRNPSFFDTHPGSQERAAVNAIRASELRWTRDPSIGDPREALLRHTEGMPVGERPEAGLFEGDRFIHPDLDFTLRFPPGWRVSNSSQAVGAMAPKGDAVVFLTADMPAGEPRVMAETWVEKTREQQKIQVKESKPVKIGSLPAWRMRVNQSGRGGSITSFVTFIPYHGATWRITGSTPASQAKNYLGRTLATARSFRPLTEEERHSLYATHMQVVEARRGEDLPSLGERTENAWNPTSTAIHNGVFTDHRYDGGEMVKVAVSEPYVPKDSTPESAEAESP